MQQLEQLRCRGALDMSGDHNATARLFYDIGTNNVGTSVVAPLDQHIWKQLPHKRFHAQFRKNREPTDTTQGAEHGDAIIQGLERTPRSLQLPDTVIVVESHHEDVSTSSRRLEAVHVAPVEQIETPIGEHDLLSLPTPDLASPNQFAPGKEFQMWVNRL